MGQKKREEVSIIRGDNIAMKRCELKKPSFDPGGVFFFILFFISSPPPAPFPRCSSIVLLNLLFPGFFTLCVYLAWNRSCFTFAFDDKRRANRTFLDYSMSVYSLQGKFMCLLESTSFEPRYINRGEWMNNVKWKVKERKEKPKKNKQTNKRTERKERSNSSSSRRFYWILLDLSVVVRQYPKWYETLEVCNTCLAVLRSGHRTHTQTRGSFRPAKSFFNTRTVSAVCSTTMRATRSKTVERCVIVPRRSIIVRRDPSMESSDVCQRLRSAREPRGTLSFLLALGQKCLKEVAFPASPPRLPSPSSVISVFFPLRSYEIRGVSSLLFFRQLSFVRRVVSFARFILDRRPVFATRKIKWTWNFDWFSKFSFDNSSSF